MTSADPVILNGEVARNVIYYKDLLEGMRFYQEALEDLLNVPEVEVNPIAFYLQECAKGDRQLLDEMGLSQETSSSSLPEVIGNNYSRLHTYFNTPPIGEIGFKWRSSAIGILEHLGHYVQDLRFEHAEVSWVSGRVFDMVREEYEQKLLPHFEEVHTRLSRLAMDIISTSSGSPVEEPTHSISLFPLITATKFDSRFQRGVIYLKMSKQGGVEEPSTKVYFDVSRRDQILFDDLPGGKYGHSEIEPDVGYVIDTISEKGLVAKPKMSLKAALNYLAKKRE